MRKGVLLGSIAALGLAGQALAQDGFSYTYVDVGYIHGESDGADSDGFGVFGSIEFTDLVHGFASYSDVDYDVGPVDVSVDAFEIGVGLAWPVNRGLDFVGRLSYLSVDAGAADDDGIGLYAGVRSRVMDRLELTGGLKFVSFDEGDDDTSIEVGARYFFTDSLAGGLDIGLNDGAPTFVLGVRFNFGN